MKRSETSGRVSSFRSAAAGLGLTVITAGLLLVPASSAGEVPAQGSAKMILGSGKSAKALSKARVKITSVNADAPVPLSRGRVQLGFPVASVTVSEERSVISLVGSLVFSKGKKRARVGQLSIVAREDRTVVRGRIGGSVRTVLRAGGPAEVNSQVGTVAIASKKADLTRGTARLLARKFRISKLPASKLGAVSTANVQAAFSDPYGTRCNLPATSKTAGNLPAPLMRPTISSPTKATGQRVDWGIRSGLRLYLAQLGSGGLMQGEGGATLGPDVPAPFPPFDPYPSGFTWPFKSGEFDSTSTNVVDDKAVLEGSGKIVLCHKGQFRVNLSNPSIVIDGLEAQLIFDIDTNVGGSWIPTQRVALANLVTSAATATVTRDSGSITWTDVPVVLTEAGSDALRLKPGTETFRYQAGQSLETINFSLVSASG